MTIEKYKISKEFIDNFIDYMKEDEDGESRHSVDYYAGDIPGINNYLLNIDRAIARGESAEDFCNSTIPPNIMEKINNIISI